MKIAAVRQRGGMGLAALALGFVSCPASSANRQGFSPSYDPTLADQHQFAKLDDSLPALARLGRRSPGPWPSKQRFMERRSSNTGSFTRRPSIGAIRSLSASTPLHMGAHSRGLGTSRSRRWFYDVQPGKTLLDRRSNRRPDQGERWQRNHRAGSHASERRCRGELVARCAGRGILSHDAALSPAASGPRSHVGSAGHRTN